MVLTVSDGQGTSVQSNHKTRKTALAALDKQGEGTFASLKDGLVVDHYKRTVVGWVHERRVILAEEA